MTIVWNRKNDYLEVGNQKFRCSCRIRSRANGLRKPEEVIYTMPNQQPCDPVRFPLGVWMVMRPQKREDSYKAPYFIPTDAFVDLPIWELEKGRYKAPTDKTDRDRGYGLHYSTSSTTQGCIRIDSKDELLALVALINNAIDAFEPVRLIVTEEKA